MMIMTQRFGALKVQAAKATETALAPIWVSVLTLFATEKRISETDVPALKRASGSLRIGKRFFDLP